MLDYAVLFVDIVYIYLPSEGVVVALSISHGWFQLQVLASTSLSHTVFSPSRMSASTPQDGSREPCGFLLHMTAWWCNMRAAHIHVQAKDVMMMIVASDTPVHRLKVETSTRGTIIHPAQSSRVPFTYVRLHRRQRPAETEAGIALHPEGASTAVIIMLL